MSEKNIRTRSLYSKIERDDPCRHLNGEDRGISTDADLTEAYGRLSYCD